MVLTFQGYLLMLKYFLTGHHYNGESELSDILENTSELLSAI